MRSSKENLRPSWIFNRNNFSYFWFASLPDTSYKVSSQLVFWFGRGNAKQIFKMAAIANEFASCPDTSYQVSTQQAFQEKKLKIDFQDGHYGSHLGFQNDFSYFYLQDILSTKFWISLPFGSGKEAQNKFLRWLPWRLSWVSDRPNFSYFWSTSCLDTLYQVSSQIGFLVQENRRKIYFQDGGHGGNLEILIETNKLVLIYRSS